MRGCSVVGVLPKFGWRAKFSRKNEGFFLKFCFWDFPFEYQISKASSQLGFKSRLISMANLRHFKAWQPGGKSAFDFLRLYSYWFRKPIILNSTLGSVMKGLCWNGRTAYPVIALLVFFSLFTTISLFGLDYFDSRTLLPDEYLDIVKISQRYFPFVGEFNVLAPLAIALKIPFHNPLLEVFCLQPSNSQSSLTTTLRC